MEKRGLVERLPDVITNRTSAWELTHDGLELVKDVSRRLEVFDRLVEQELHGHVDEVMDAMMRLRTVVTTGSLSRTGSMLEARLRAAGKLAPPKKWKAVLWDL